jgi:hypothetical protein
VKIILPNNYFISEKDSSSNNEIDSDINKNTKISESKILVSDENYL